MRARGRSAATGRRTGCAAQRRSQPKRRKVHGPGNRIHAYQSAVPRRVCVCVYMGVRACVRQMKTAKAVPHAFNRTTTKTHKPRASAPTCFP